MENKDDNIEKSIKELDERNGIETIWVYCEQCDEEYLVQEDVEFCPICGGEIEEI